MRWFGKKNNEPQVEPKKELPTLMDNAATLSGMGDEWGAWIAQGRGHHEHKTDQAKDIGEVIRDEINTLTGGEKKK